MKHTKSAPDWAVELVIQVCKDYNRALPRKFSWHNTRSRYISNADGSMREIRLRPKYSSGVTYYGKHSKIHVTAGHSYKDQRLILLHELAHHIVTKRKSQGHNLKFWRLAFELYDKYGDPNTGLTLDYARERESYLKTSDIAFRELATAN